MNMFKDRDAERDGVACEAGPPRHHHVLGLRRLLALPPGPGTPTHHAALYFYLLWISICTAALSLRELKLGISKFIRLSTVSFNVLQ